jgi:prepilin peptidase CpaA
MFEAPVLIFAGLVLFAAAHDVATMKIPNWVSIAIVAAFPLAGLWAGLSLSQIGFGLLMGAIALAFCFAMFQFNLMGGGDAKLIAACCVWVGWVGMWAFVPWMTMAGAVLAITLVGLRAWIKPKDTHPAFLTQLLTPTKGAPYGVAIAAGALVALPMSPIAAALAAG